MTYVVSDIHGCDKKYFRLLEMLHFSDTDTLYILGDVVDRGSGGLRVLLDAASRQNVILLRGNHEQAALEFLPRDPDNEATPARLFARWYEWMEDGGDRTYRAFWNRSDAVRARVPKYLLFKTLPYSGWRCPASPSGRWQSPPSCRPPARSAGF